MEKLRFNTSLRQIKGIKSLKLSFYAPSGYGDPVLVNLKGCGVADGSLDIYDAWEDELRKDLNGPKQ